MDFYRLNLSGQPIFLGSTRLLTEIITRSIFWGAKEAGAYGWPNIVHVPILWNFGSLEFSGLLQACICIVLNTHLVKIGWTRWNSSIFLGVFINVLWAKVSILDHVLSSERLNAPWILEARTRRARNTGIYGFIGKKFIHKNLAKKKQK
jgi:hypothetical protein